MNVSLKTFYFGLLLFTFFASHTGHSETSGDEPTKGSRAKNSAWIEDTKKKISDDLVNIKKFSALACREFEKNPKSYQEVKEADMAACEFYTKPWNKIPFLTKESCYSPQPKKEQSKPEKFLVRSNGGSCQSSGVARITNDEQPELEFIEILNSGENGYGMGNYDKILKTPFPFQLVTNDKYSDLRAITDQGSYILCRFSNRLDGWRVTEWNRASVCEKFANDEFVRTDRKLGEGETAADYLVENVPRYADLYEISTVDIDENGTAEKILKMTHYSGAGCGSTDISLRVAHKGNDASEVTSVLDKKISELTENQGDWLVIEIDGKIYIAKNADKIIPNKTQFSQREFKDRILYEFKTDGFQEVCRLKPMSKRINIKDIPNNTDLGYKPIEKID